MDDAPIYAPRFGRGSRAPHFEIAYRAISQSARLRMRYTADDGMQSERSIRPLGLYFWGKVWTLAAWCETRGDFRSFRLDRMREPKVAELFTSEPGKTLDVFLARMRAEPRR